MLNLLRKTMITAACLMAPAAIAAGQAQAPDFSLRAIDGQTVTAASLHGEVAVLAFGASWLPLTRNQMESLKKLADQYAGRGVAVYWVSTESENAKSKNYVSDDQLRDLARRYKVSILRDPDGAVSRRLGVDQLPSVVIFDKQGNVADRTGGMDPDADLAKLLAEKLNKLG
jgi:peroxiredoxin